MKKSKKMLITGLGLVLSLGSLNVVLNQLGYNIDYRNIIACATNNDSVIIEVPHLSQEEYPTGCESVSTVMALNYMGYNITVDDFIDNYLDMCEIIYKDNKMYADNPNDSFIGNPRSKDSFGCYAPVICNAVKKYAQEENLKDLEVKNLTGKSLKSICNEYIKNGTPVIVWATIDMQPSVKGKTWNLVGTKDKTFTWISKEHCLLLVGYDNNYYYFNDPQQSLKDINQVVAFDRKIVEKRYKELGSQAVVIDNSILE